MLHVLNINYSESAKAKWTELQAAEKLARTIRNKLIEAGEQHQDIQIAARLCKWDNKPQITVNQTGWRCEFTPENREPTKPPSFTPSKPKPYVPPLGQMLDRSTINLLLTGKMLDADQKQAMVRRLHPDMAEILGEPKAAPDPLVLAQDQVDELDKFIDLVAELCTAVDCEAEDIGGQRPSGEILREIGGAFANVRAAVYAIQVAAPGE